GETVLPFKSSLLEPTARNMHALTAGSISYELDDGDVSEEVCYWKDMTLVPHLINLLSKRSVHAELRFAETPRQATDRKLLARQLHSQVLHLKAAIYRLPGSSESTDRILASCRKAAGFLLAHEPATVSESVSVSGGSVVKNSSLVRTNF